MKKFAPKMLNALNAESKFEEHLLEQALNHFKDLPPLQPGWVYDFIPSEAHYNPDTKCYEGTIKAIPRQMISLQEQPVCEELEERIRNVWEDDPHAQWAKCPFVEFQAIARHFAQWQKEHDEEIINAVGDIPGDIEKAYNNGRKDMREEMLREAVERIVKEDAGGYPYIDATELYDYTEDKPLAKKGDKVRIVIVKEDKQ